MKNRLRREALHSSQNAGTSAAELLLSTCWTRAGGDNESLMGRSGTLGPWIPFS